jgi:hypothetical protein
MITGAWKKWSTVRTNFGHLIGAMQHVDPLVAKCRCVKDYIRHIESHHAQEEPDYPFPVSRSVMFRILEELKIENDITTLTFLCIMWQTTQRPGCVGKLRTRNVAIDVNNDRLTALFTEGKAVAALGQPYVIHTAAGVFRNSMTTYLRQRLNQEYLFDQSKIQKMKDKARLLLRRFVQHERVDLRSVRRGAAEALAQVLTVPQVRRFTQHTNDEQTMRYLRWGQAATADFEPLVQAVI